MEKYFLVQIKRTNRSIEKGVVVKDTLDTAGLQIEARVDNRIQQS